ncbi:MAG: oligopeptide transporter ATP-binding protein, partial [Frankiales bacterium]|nr:oligopeptide transporter ATP-binding protein [Frankiales bacterium]
KCVEYGSVNEVFYEPQHPYTWGLLSSVTRLDRVRTDRLKPIAGSPPSLINIPNGCAFHPRCPYEPLTGGKGSTEVPPLVDAGKGHLVRCHLSNKERTDIFIQQVKPTL